MTLRRNGLALTVLLARASFPTASFMRRFGTNMSGNGIARDSPEFWYYITVSSLLVLAGGVFAGYFFNYSYIVEGKRHDIYSLTLGLMGLDELHLRVLATSSEDKTEKRNAQKGSMGGYAAFIIGDFPQC